MGQEKLILIIDDDENMRELMREKIHNNFGNQVRITESVDGLEATRKLDNQAFDCIITDMKMPRRNGIEFIKWVKEHRNNKTAPIILVTGFGKPEGIENFKNVYFIEKPFDEAEFIKLLKTQILLGKTDQRVPSELLEAFSQATLKYLQESIDPEVHFEKPKIKKLEESLPGNIIGAISVKTSGSTGRIAVGFSNNFIIHLREDRPKQPGEGPAVNSAIDSIFRHLGEVIKKSDGKPPIYEQKRILSDKNNFEAKELERRAAVIVPVNTPFGDIFLMAFGGSTKTAHTKSS